MRLDFNETNILLQTLNDLSKQPNIKISKATVIGFLYNLYDNTDTQYKMVRNSVKSLILKLEGLSEESIKTIIADKEKNFIIATTCYKLP